MIFENKEPDIDLLIKCLIENGCTVKKAKDGEGGIYLKGKKLTDEELMDCVMRPLDEDDYRDVRDWLAVAPTVIEAEGGRVIDTL